MIRPPPSPKVPLELELSLAAHKMDLKRLSSFLSGGDVGFGHKRERANDTVGWRSDKELSTSQALTGRSNVLNFTT